MKGVRKEEGSEGKGSTVYEGRDDGRRETETLFQLTSPMSAIRRPGRETLKE